MPSKSICQNIKEIRKNVPTSIIILAATKDRTVLEIQDASAAGIMHMGENYVQETEKKSDTFTKLKKRGLTLHCIGHLQSNKAKKAVELFDVIQTVDSRSLLQLLGKESNHQQKRLQILIQINIGNEPQKAGCTKEEIPLFLEEIIKYPNMEWKGFMCIPPSIDQELYFKQMKLLKDMYHAEILSMGMTHDYPLAIKYGSTMIRIGEGIFGRRQLAKVKIDKNK